jgi:ketosteroid isomerase-like protein
MVVTVREGKIARIDEYFDSAQLPGKKLPEIPSQS